AARRSTGMSKPTSSLFARFAFSAIGCGLLAILGCWFATGDDLAPRAGSSAAPQPATCTVADAASVASTRRDDVRGALGCLGAPAGSTFRYRVTDRSDFEVNSPEGGLQPAGTLHVECFVTTTVLDRHADELLVQQQIEELRFLGQDGRKIEHDPVQASFAAAAAAPVLIRLDGHGKALGYGFADGLDGDQRNFLRGTLASLAFQAPEPQAKTWTCAEADTTGDYDARYDVLPSADAADVTVRRTRLHYTTIGAKPELPTHELRGAGEARFSTALGWLVETKLDEGMTMALPMLDLQMITSRRASARLVAADHVEVPADVAGAWGRTDAPVTGRLELVGQFAKESQRRLWQQTLQGVTLDALLAELGKLLQKQPADDEAVNNAFQKLQWLIKLDDGVARDLGERLATRQLGGDLAGVALSSLGAAGTKAAQAVLTAVRADRSLDAGLRQAATVSTLQLAEPSPELVAGLAKDAGEDFDGRSGAMLVLGALAPRSSAPLADGRTPVATLLAMESDATARGDLSTWMLAVGNSGAPETLGIAQRLLGHGEASVRGAACVALRGIAGPAALGALVERGITDTDPDVRQEAVLALGRRPEAAAREAIRRVAENDPDEAVRGRANRILHPGS
ncbi:MAG TPA: HEAT repeat domain-containing protein, partial [Planctomycetota bacterium]|nr:HEAT repeat domain-containing protein [Planctomycetota bacterium]